MFLSDITDYFIPLIYLIYYYKLFFIGVVVMQTNAKGNFRYVKNLEKQIGRLWLTEKN